MARNGKNHHDGLVQPVETETAMVTQQRRSRKIAMTSEELDAFLANERTCRVATVSATGAPHNTPLWFDRQRWGWFRPDGLPDDAHGP